MVTSMLEKAIEIEGLLRIIRDGEPLPETYILLNIKAAELAEQAVCLEERASAPKSETAQADFVMASPKTPAPSTPEVIFTVHEPAIIEEKAAALSEAAPDYAEDDPETADDDLSLIEEDDILLTFDDPGDFSISTSSQASSKEEEDTTEEERDSTPLPFESEGAHEEESEINSSELTVFIEKPSENVEGPSEGIEEHSEDAESPSEDIEEHSEDIEEATATETHQEAPQPIDTTKLIDTAKLLQQSKPHIKLKSAFSLNDCFLYARELFEGNMKMFDSTLEFIEGIEDYSIIEDYFYSELEWDPENSHVAAFMEILRPHFKE